MSGLWPSELRVRRPGDRPAVVLRALRVRDRVEWERLRADNAEWIRPWESMSPEPGRVLRFAQLVRHYDREARAGRAQPFVIESQGRLVGQMHLTQIVWGRRGPPMPATGWLNRLRARASRQRRSRQSRITRSWVWDCTVSPHSPNPTMPPACGCWRRWDFATRAWRGRRCSSTAPGEIIDSSR